MAVIAAMQTGAVAKGNGTRASSSSRTAAEDGDILDTGQASGSASARGAGGTDASASTGGAGFVAVEDDGDPVGVVVETEGHASGDGASSDSDLWIKAIATPGADVVVGQARSRAAGGDDHDASASAEGFGDVTGGGGAAVDNPHHAFAIDTAAAVDLPI